MLTMDPNFQRDILGYVIGQVGWPATIPGMSPAVRLEASRLGERLMASQQAEMTGDDGGKAREIFVAPKKTIQFMGIVYLPTFSWLLWWMYIYVNIPVPWMLWKWMSKTAGTLDELEDL